MISLSDINKIKVAAYCRVSTEKDDQLSSLDNQKKFFEEYTKIHNYELTELYADEGISGTKLKNRKAFNKMMKDAELGKFSRVFVKDISRFARNAVDFLNSIRELKSMGIKCEFVNANLSTEDGEFTLGILALVAQEESANLSKRVKFGKSKNAENGKVPNIIYGYNKKKGDLFNLEINKSESLIVKKIFTLYTEYGYSSNKIAKTLNNEFIKTKRGYNWSQNAITRILKNPIYIGQIVNGKETIQDFLTGIRIKNNSDKWIIKENSSLSIIDKNTFDKAQVILSNKRKNFKINKKRDCCKYTLSNMIICGNCGYSFRRLHRHFATKEYIKWVCSGRNTNGKEFCSNNIVIDETEIINEICHQIINLIPCKNKFINKTLNALKSELIQKSMIIDEKSILNELSKLRKIKSKQTEMYESEIITIDELKYRVKEINNKIKEYELKLNMNYNEHNDILNIIKSKYFNNIETLVSNKIIDNNIFKLIIKKIIINENNDILIILK